MKKNDGILLGQPGELMEMLFFNTYQGTVNIKALTHHLFYLLDGNLTLLYQAKKYVLSTDDIFFIPLEEVIILSSEQCHALTLAIPPSRFSSSNPQIYCNSALYPNPHYDKLRGLLAALLPLLSSAPAYGQEKTKKAFRDISVFLSKYFHAPETPATSLQPEALPFSQNKHQIFLKDVLHDINANYTKRVTLGSLAKQYYVSTSYLSKLFLKETGLHFNDYVLNLRLSDAMSMVVFSKYSLSEIAQRSGFPDTRSLHDAFSKANGIGPAEYRKQLAKQADSSEKTAQEVNRLTKEGYFQRLLQYLETIPSLPVFPNQREQELPSSPSSSPTPTEDSLSCRHSLHVESNSVPFAARHFSLLLSDWICLQTKELQNLLCRFKKEARLESVALLLPKQQTIPSSGFLSVMDFFYQKQFHVFLLYSDSPDAFGSSASDSSNSDSSGSSCASRSLETEAKPEIEQLLSALQQHYQGRLSVTCQKLSHYLENKTQILPFSTEATLLHDTCFSASFLLEQLFRAVNIPSAAFLKELPAFHYYYTMPSDLCCSLSPVSPASSTETLSFTETLETIGTFSGKPGLFTASGTAKPSFYAFCFFSKLGQELLYQKDEILITRTENQIQILFYQPSVASLSGTCNSAPGKKLSLRLQGFSCSYVMLTEQRLSPDSGLGLEGWLSLGYAANYGSVANHGHIADLLLPYALEKHLEPVPSLKKRVLPVEENTLLLEYELLPGEICLLNLETVYLAK